MGAKHGRLEAQITVPTATWTFTVEGATDGSGQTATLAAGTYYITDFVSACKIAADAASADTWTFAFASGEDGTGKVSISSPSWVSLDWVDTEVRDLLGFEDDGNITGTATATGTDQAKMMWLPNQPHVTLLGANDDGWRESDSRSTESPGGLTHTVYGNNKVVNQITWNAISRAKCRVAGEVTGNESFEQFWLDAVLGTGPGGTPGARWQFYWDADVATALNCTAHGLENWQPQQLVSGMVENWLIVVPRLVKVPA